MLVICINGAINSGKTTIGRALSSILPDAEFIDGDDHDAPEGIALEKMIDHAMDRLVRIINRWSRSFLVIAYPLRQEDFVRLQHATRKSGADIFVVTLAPPLSIALSNRGTRLLSDGERIRIREMYAEGYANRDFSNMRITEIDSPQGIARSIAKAVGL